MLSGRNFSQNKDLKTKLGKNHKCCKKLKVLSITSNRLKPFSDINTNTLLIYYHYSDPISQPLIEILVETIGLI